MIKHTFFKVNVEGKTQVKRFEVCIHSSNITHKGNLQLVSCILYLVTCVLSSVSHPLQFCLVFNGPPLSSVQYFSLPLLQQCFVFCPPPLQLCLKSFAPPLQLCLVFCPPHLYSSVQCFAFPPLYQCLLFSPPSFLVVFSVLPSPPLQQCLVFWLPFLSTNYTCRREIEKEIVIYEYIEETIYSYHELVVSEETIHTTCNTKKLLTQNL